MTVKRIEHNCLVRVASRGFANPLIFSLRFGEDFRTQKLHGMKLDLHFLFQIDLREIDSCNAIIAMPDLD